MIGSAAKATDNKDEVDAIMTNNLPLMRGGKLGMAELKIPSLSSPVNSQMQLTLKCTLSLRGSNLIYSIYKIILKFLNDNK